MVHAVACIHASHCCVHPCITLCTLSRFAHTSAHTLSHYDTHLHAPSPPTNHTPPHPHPPQLSKYAETKLKMQALQRENVVLLSELESQQEKNARLEVQVTQCIKLLRQLLKSQERVIPVLQVRRVVSVCVGGAYLWRRMCCIGCWCGCIQ